MKKIYKMLFLLLLLPLFNTACFKTKTPDSGGEEAKIFCGKFPDSDLCLGINGHPEFLAERVKPIIMDNPLSEPIYWSSSQWEEGYEAHVGEDINVDFSLDLGSILNIGEPFTTYVYSFTTGARISVIPNLSISSVLGGHTTITLNGLVDHKLILVAIFSRGIGYINLPPVNVVA